MIAYLTLTALYENYIFLQYMVPVASILQDYSLGVSLIFYCAPQRDRAQTLKEQDTIVPSEGNPQL